MKFGRLYHPDRRDAKFAISAKRSKRTYRYWQSDVVTDQGDMPSCVGHAWCHWTSCVPRPAYLNGDYLYSLCKFVDEWQGEDYDGTSVRAGAKIAAGMGILSGYQWAQTKDALIYTLLEQGPVVAGTWWYGGMSDDSTGLIEPTGDNLGGHAYLVDGINTRTGLARIKCAWWKSPRTPWGDHGRVFIDIDQLWRLIADDGEACLGVKRDVRRVT